MILICDKCSTKYFVDESSIAPAGKNVKCIKCGYIWFQDLPTQQHIKPTNIELEPIPQGSSLPVIIETKNSIWLKILPVFFACMIIVTATGIYRDPIIKKFPFISGFYNYIGMPSTNNLKLEDISLVKGKDYLNINGFLASASPHERKIPNIAITISDIEGKKLLTTEIEPSGNYINIGEKLPIHKRIFNLPPNAYHIKFDITDLFSGS